MFGRKKVTKIEITSRNIIFTVFFLISLYLLFLIRDVLIALFVSILVATALNPLVNRLEKYKLPRVLAALLVYLSLVAAIVFLIGAIIPPLVSQTEKLIEAVPPEILSDQFQLPDLNAQSFELLTTQLDSVMPILKLLSSTFSSLVTLFTFAVISFYLLVERNDLHTYLASIIQEEDAEAKAKKVIIKIEDQIGGWVRGQFTLMIIVGVITYVGLRLLGIPFAIPLAILAGFLEIIPNIGPTISAIPAILVPLVINQDPLTAVFVLALYVLVQQFENNLMVPKIMQSAVGIHPLITILLIVIGLKLSGISGAILAVPVYLVAKVFYTEIGKPYFSGL